MNFTPHGTASHILAKQSSGLSPASMPFAKASMAGSKASSMVFSPRSALPRSLIPPITASIIFFPSSKVISFFPVTAPAAFIYAVPYNGPEAPPTFDSSTMPVFFKITLISSSSWGSWPSTSVNPLAMLIPWSASPIAESKSVRNSLFAMISSPIFCIH